MKITGRPLRLTPAELSAAAIVTDDDLRDARRDWQSRVPSKYRLLLSARGRSRDDDSD